MKCPMCKNDNLETLNERLKVEGDDKISMSTRVWHCKDCGCIFSSTAAYHNYPIRRFNKNAAR